MPEDEKNLATEQAQELGGDSEGSSLQELPNETPSGDPLDTIEDTTALRAEAKKYRAIAQRVAKKPKEEVQPAKVETPSDVLTKTDLFRINTQKATKAALEDTFIKANWDAIRGLYVGRRGQEDPDAIVEDIKDAVAVFKARNSEVKEDPAAALTTTNRIKSSSAPVQSGDRKTERLIRKPEPFTDWFKKSQ